MGALWK